jgi:hypothetical protein
MAGETEGGLIVAARHGAPAARRRGRRAGTWLRAGILAGLLASQSVALLAGCAAWRRQGETCVRESDDGERRVINYTDPELCNRPVKKRQPDYLRVPPPMEG